MTTEQEYLRPVFNNTRSMSKHATNTKEPNTKQPLTTNPLSILVPTHSTYDDSPLNKAIALLHKLST